MATPMTTESKPDTKAKNSADPDKLASDQP